MTAPTFALMKPRYTKLWADMKILPSREPGIKAAAALILRNKMRYIAVCQSLGISEDWWVMIGGIHYREGSCSFRTHLHNGDPLTHRTYHVPAGRPPLPLNPPFTWEQSANDALRMRGIQHLGPFSVELMAYTDEGYNGWGYEYKGQTSSYDWAGSNDHPSGKFVADHVYSRTAVDAQEGTMPLLVELMAMDPSVKAFVEASEHPAASPTAADTRPATSMPPVLQNAPAVSSVAPKQASKGQNVPLWKRMLGWR